ncbi:MAG: twin-arginine translocase subunit TatC [Candidatus Methanoperedenaceae archaeon]|nr:twin-arginine translocase subunit TatC [Candidatus Methanoperedenaceae archaeon]MDW7726284.1 twin-arginine translocase subunit TatC [Candidatus Methanoperedens sp.]
MALEDFTLVLSELRKRLFYLIAFFGASVVVSFSLMGNLILKIQSDMFWHLQIPGNTDISGRLVDISSNLTAMSGELAKDNEAIAQNLTLISGELVNISMNLGMFKPNIVYLAPMEVLMLKFKMAVIFGLLITSPMILYYAVAGIRKRFDIHVPLSRSLLIYTAAAAAGLFLLGASYAYYYMLPFLLGFLYQDAINMGVSATFSVYSFVYFVMSTTLIIGLTFELPIILTLLVRLGLTDREKLVYYRRHAYIVLLIIAAVITPDPTFISQVMVAVPFIVLYEISLLLMKISGTKTRTL